MAAAVLPAESGPAATAWADFGAMGRAAVMDSSEGAEMTGQQTASVS